MSRHKHQHAEAEHINVSQGNMGVPGGSADPGPDEQDGNLSENHTTSSVGSAQDAPAKKERKPRTPREKPEIGEIDLDAPIPEPPKTLEGELAKLTVGRGALPLKHHSLAKARRMVNDVPKPNGEEYVVDMHNGHPHVWRRA